ncbi:hypothetical protein HKW98_09125 [Stutzerimonas urumqiensis]|uniref:hypothetical protein n=1 Tax=Stutzerimonas urumqiensis TaxID=638269 RepID=UPI003BAD2C4A
MSIDPRLPSAAPKLAALAASHPLLRDFLRQLGLAADAHMRALLCWKIDGYLSALFWMRRLSPDRYQSLGQELDRLHAGLPGQGAAE